MQTTPLLEEELLELDELELLLLEDELDEEELLEDELPDEELDDELEDDLELTVHEPSGKPLVSFVKFCWTSVELIALL